MNGFIHRDVKAANLLVDDDGTVLLGDLGVAADLSEDTSLHLPPSKMSLMCPSSFAQSEAQSVTDTSLTQKRIVVFDHTVSIPERPSVGKRKSFVGTPCWMAPELIQGHQYDSSADIWSFGITALELSQGRPPKSKDTPQRVLLRTIQDDPPTVDRQGGTFKYSRGFKDVIDWCLNKNPYKRPTAQELLQTSLFKSAKKRSYLVGTILRDLPPLSLRQERRAVKLPHALSTLDSWDFATTVHSPAADYHRIRNSKEFTHQSEGSVDCVCEKGDDRGYFKAIKPASTPGNRTRNHDRLTSSSLSSSSAPATALLPNPVIAPGNLPSSAPEPINPFSESSSDDHHNNRAGKISVDFTPIKASQSISPTSHDPSQSISQPSTSLVHPGFWNKLKFNVRLPISRNGNMVTASRFSS